MLCKCLRCVALAFLLVVASANTVPNMKSVGKSTLLVLSGSNVRSTELRSGRSGRVRRSPSSSPARSGAGNIVNTLEEYPSPSAKNAQWRFDLRLTLPQQTTATAVEAVARVCHSCGRSNSVDIGIEPVKSILDF